MRGWVDQKRENHPCWKGGRRVDRDGYIRVYTPDHPWPRRGGYVLEHVLRMELHIGRRLLPGECVHHIDHDRQNNDLSNLELTKRGKHSSEHRKKDVHKFVRDARGRFTCGST